MDEEINERYRKAGNIAAKARDFGKSIIEKGASYEEIVDRTERKVRELGGELAFPVNLSVNDVGAHDTADINEERVVEGGLVKLDVGVHVDGWIGDTAVTVPVDSDKQDMIDAAREALDEAIDMMVPGNEVKNISSKIEQTIRDHGYNPVTNLTGHGLERYDLHAKLQFPNVK
ncbi:MAG: M24 family metallopeptidase, partial [Candidatus Aenigmatarchaeota archaeon]